MAQLLCNRLSFMYGMPYQHDNLVPEIHGAVGVNPVLQEQFGAIPLDMFMHAAQNVRQGQATVYRQPDKSLVSDEALRNFRALGKITLITGALNRLWHRNSIDLMYEWLIRGDSGGRERVEKHVFPTYGHQDLLWGKDAADDVFATIEAGLREQPSTAAEAIRDSA